MPLSQSNDFVKLSKENTDVLPSTLPNFQVEDWPFLKLKTIRLQNFKVFADHTFDFSDGSFACLHGPNGTGKTTLLEVIQMLFFRYEGREQDRIKAMLGKSVRHVDGEQKGQCEEDFLITAVFQTENSEYEVQIDKSGFIKDHPPEIKELVYRMCYFAKYDQELEKFQLHRDKWPAFKDLFESITGFEIEEIGTMGFSVDPHLENYVFGFWVKKPNERIMNKGCSAGERKLIKSFSTVLNMSVMPRILLIDNVETHIEVGRHLNLIDAMKRCFPDTQIICTTHSVPISRYYHDKKHLFDLRLVGANSIMREQPWRFRLMDEINDSILKLKSSKNHSNKILEWGEELSKACQQEGPDLLLDANAFLCAVQIQFIKDLIVSGD